jgi:Na+/melibiose symporter-like transporter
VIQAALLEKHVASASTLAFVGSVAVACIAVFAIPNSRMLVAIGARKLAILGLLMMGGGQILSGFTEHSIVGLFITAGFVMGYGVRYVFILGAQYAC